jgi:hypothetical protein
MRGRYRIRTWLRGNLPGPLSDLFPKGKRDCGSHEWYRSSEDTDRCYHCDVGIKSHTEDLPGVAQQDEEQPIASPAAVKARLVERHSAERALFERLAK